MSTNRAFAFHWTHVQICNNPWKLIVGTNSICTSDEIEQPLKQIARQVLS